MMSRPCNDRRDGFWNVVWGLTGTETDRTNNKRFTFWCLAWAVALVAVTAFLGANDDLPRALAWAVALAPNVLALGALLSYLRLLRMTDELQRKIHLEGLAVGFGAGWIFTLAYLTLQAVGAPELSIPGMILVMTGGWTLGTWRAVRHYQ